MARPQIAEGLVPFTVQADLLFDFFEDEINTEKSDARNGELAAQEAAEETATELVATLAESLGEGAFRDTGLANTDLAIGTANIRSKRFSLLGPAVVGTGLDRIYFEVAVSVLAIVFIAGVAPVTGALVGDVNKSGSSIMGGVFPTLIPGQRYQRIDLVTPVGLLPVAADFLTADITAIGSGADKIGMLVVYETV